MAELVTYPDAESEAVDRINAEIETIEAGVIASTKIPNPRPSEFIRVLVGGGIEETIVTNTAQITIEGWAQTEARALRLCDVGRAILRRQDATIRGVRGFSYPQNLPDPTSSQARYTSTGEIRLWATVTNQ